MRAALFTEVGRPSTWSMTSTSRVRGSVRYGCASPPAGCHSDLSLMQGHIPLPGPTIPGHEAAGEVVELGPGRLPGGGRSRGARVRNPACGRANTAGGEPSVCTGSISIAMPMFPDGTTHLSRPVGSGAGGEIRCGVPRSGPRRLGRGHHRRLGGRRHPGPIPLDVACVIGCPCRPGRSAINTAAVQPLTTSWSWVQARIGISIVQGGDRRSRASSCRTPRGVTSGAGHALRCDRRDRSDETDVVGRTMEITGIGADVAFDAVGSATLVEAGLRRCAAGDRRHGRRPAARQGASGQRRPDDVHRSGSCRILAPDPVTLACVPSGRPVAVGSTRPRCHDHHRRPLHRGQRGAR